MPIAHRFFPGFVEKFQSLFWWILRYAAILHSCPMPYHLVSILVLVDLTLCQKLLLFSSIVLLCFNPCFGGSYVMPLVPEIMLDLLREFQSLFWWILRYAQ